MINGVLNTRRLVEFAALFLGIPTLLRIAPILLHGTDISISIIPVLIVLAVIILILLLRTTPFTLREFVTLSTTTRRDWIIMLARFAFFAILLTLWLLCIRPDALLFLPRRSSVFWLRVMVLYPLISVTSQSIIYRAFYTYRYAPLFPPVWRTPIGAALFSFAHLPFANTYALAFTFIGGLFFLSGYRRTRSLLFSNIEHAIYGDFLFTIGWGQFFFHAGTLQTLS